MKGTSKGFTVTAKAPISKDSKKYFLSLFQFTLFYRKVSEMLEDEAKKMEEKLDMVKKMMDLEK
jgi:hypothetical protein